MGDFLRLHASAFHAVFWAGWSKDRWLPSGSAKYTAMP